MSNEKEIKAGDVVFLKSDLHRECPMTVEYLTESKAACIWVDKAEIKRVEILKVALEVR